MLSEVDRSFQLTLYLKGHALRPELITNALSVEPTKSHEKGRRWFTSSGKEVVEKTGLWTLSLRGGAKDAPRIIQEISLLADNAGVSFLDIPGVDSGFLDILLIADSDEQGGGTCELSLDEYSMGALLDIGLPVEMTFTVVVQKKQGSESNYSFFAPPCIRGLCP